MGSGGPSHGGSSVTPIDARAPSICNTAVTGIRISSINSVSSNGGAPSGAGLPSSQYSTGSTFDFAALDEALALGAAARKDIMASTNDTESQSDEDDDSYMPDSNSQVHSNLRANVNSVCDAQALPPSLPSGHTETVWKGRNKFAQEQKGKVSPDTPQMDSPTSVLQRFRTMRSRRAASHELWCKVSDVLVPLVLLPTGDDFRQRASALSYNALVVELRDLYRMLDGMAAKSEQGQLVIKDVTIFYEWFEGFFGIVTSLYETLDDVMFPWLEKIATLSLAKSLSPKRRNAKQARTKDVCWDILELKMMMQNSADKKRSKAELSALVHEVAGEVDVMALRILAFVSALQDEVPTMLTTHFQQDELDIMEETLIQNLRASNPGKFVLCAFTRALECADARAAYLDRVFPPKKGKKNSGLKQYKRFYSRHVDLVDVLAVGKKMPCSHREQEDTEYERSNFGAGDAGPS